jgi:hypothetical protein
VFNKIFLGTRVSDGRMDDLARRDFKIRDQGLCTVSFITILDRVTDFDFFYPKSDKLTMP